jgi:hypothetical protein
MIIVVRSQEGDVGRGGANGEHWYEGDDAKASRNATEVARPIRSDDVDACLEAGWEGRLGEQDALRSVSMYPSRG